MKSAYTTTSLLGICLPTALLYSKHTAYSQGELGTTSQDRVRHNIKRGEGGGAVGAKNG